MKDKRERIIETALHLFAQKGFEGTSIRDIAEKATVNVAMVNYYFEPEEPVHTNALTEVGTMQSNVAEYTPTSLSRGRNPL